jgi:hypothetical protein
MSAKLDFRAFSIALFIASLVSYILCIVGDVWLDWTMYQVWMPLMPGFTWPLTPSGSNLYSNKISPLRSSWNHYSNDTSKLISYPASITPVMLSYDNCHEQKCLPTFTQCCA